MLASVHRIPSSLTGSSLQLPHPASSPTGMEEMRADAEALGLGWPEHAFSGGDQARLLLRMPPGMY